MRAMTVSPYLFAKAACWRPVAVLFALLWLLLSLQAQRALADDVQGDADWQGIAAGQQAIMAPLAAASLLQDVARSGDRLLAVGERGHILISTDEGASWQQVPAVPTRSMLISITAAGDQLWAVGHDSVILHSNDGGDSWQLVSEEPGGDPLLEVMFDEQGVGLAIGAYNLLMRSDDWGTNWSVDTISDLLVEQEAAENDDEDSLNEMGLIDQDAMAEYEDEGIQYHLNGLIRLQDDTLLVAAEAGRYFISTDGGDSWSQHELDYQGSLFGVTHMRQAGCLVMYGLRGHVFQNCEFNDDDGDQSNWNEIRTDSDAGLFAAAEDQAGRLWLVGANGAIFSLAANGELQDFTVDQGDDFTAVMPLADGLLLLGESGPQRKPYSNLQDDATVTGQ